MAIDLSRISETSVPRPRPSTLRSWALRLVVAVSVLPNCGRSPLERIQPPDSNPPISGTVLPDASAQDIKPADVLVPDIRPIEDSAPEISFEASAPDIKPAIDVKPRMFCQDIDLKDFKIEIPNQDGSTHFIDVIEVSNNASFISLQHHITVNGVYPDGGTWPGDDVTTVDLTNGQYKDSYLWPYSRWREDDYWWRVGSLRDRIVSDLQQITDPADRSNVQAVIDCLSALVAYP